MPNNIYFDSLIINGESIPFTNKIEYKPGIQKAEQVLVVNSGKQINYTNIDPTSSNQAEVKFSVPWDQHNGQKFDEWGMQAGTLTLSLRNTQSPGYEINLKDASIVEDITWETMANDGISITIRGLKDK